MELEQKLRNLIADALQAGSSEVHRLLDWLHALEHAKLEVNVLTSKVERELLKVEPKIGPEIVPPAELVPAVEVKP